jgi:thiol-disulfide isomerase/thioredoxin
MKKYFFLVAALAAFTSCNNSSNVQTDVVLAPELNLPNRDGENVSLNSMHGNIVLVDFWASWCPPCRAENPKIVAMYNRVKDMKLPNGGKFIIYSVSLDDNKLAWVSAIQEDHLDWPTHVSDLKGWRSKAAATYGVEAIPTNVLVDTSGAVLGRDLSTPEIEVLLQERLK